MFKATDYSSAQGTYQAQYTQYSIAASQHPNETGMIRDRKTEVQRDYITYSRSHSYKLADQRFELRYLKNSYVSDDTYTYTCICISLESSLYLIVLPF